MSQTTTPPIITFSAGVTTNASPQTVYDVLADLRTHGVWAGEQSPNKKFHLLRIDAPARTATVGDEFSSDGVNSNGTFHDRSTITQADPAKRFGFDTDSILDRKHGKPLRTRFQHRYVIEPSAGGAVVRYTCETWPQNYVPYWLKRGMRPMTRRMVDSMMSKNLRNLTAMAESRTLAAS